MSELKEVVSTFLINNTETAEEMLTEGRYDLKWQRWEGTPLETRCVDSYGGEGDGDQYYTVLEVRLPENTNETLFIKLYGSYASYYGVDYQSWNFVTPKQKTIAVYD